MRALASTVWMLAAWLAVGTGCGPHAAVSREHGGHGERPGNRIRDTASYIALLEREDRARWQKPDQVIAAMALKPGERVADIGAGSGYFTIPLAKAVGPQGVVWAVDIKQGMLDHIAERTKAEQLKNVRPVLAAEDDPKLPAGGVDTILIVNTYHHFPDRNEYAKMLRAALAPGGRVVNIDFVPKTKEERGFGPSFDHQLARKSVDAEMAAVGLRPICVHDFLPEQYFVEYAAE